MKYLTPPQILAKLKEFDKNTIFNTASIISFVKCNNISYSKAAGRYFINFDEFLEKINPKHINKHYDIPKIRKKERLINLFNKRHKSKIDLYILDKCLKISPQAFFHDFTLYLINYDLLEDTLIAYLMSRGKYEE